MRPNQQETADLVTFTEETLNVKLYFLCSVLMMEASERKKFKSFFFEVSYIVFPHYYWLLSYLSCFSIFKKLSKLSRFYKKTSQNELSDACN